VFFFASAAASSAYLTSGESFPLEMRARGIALFYALGTAVGGVVGPWLFGFLIDTGERSSIAWGYAFGSVLMLLAAALELVLDVPAERRPLEHVATPLSVADGLSPGLPGGESTCLSHELCEARRQPTSAGSLRSERSGGE